MSPDDLVGLKLPHVQTRAQLNEVEAANILQGQQWISKQPALTLDKLFHRDFVVMLHKKLFGEVWAWAGTFRQREVNIGVDSINIPVDLHNFLEDAKCWVEFNHFSRIGLNARIQHRLVQIHPFPNGNGRHSRIFTNIVTTNLLKALPVKWANTALENTSAERERYINALRKADAGDFLMFEQYLTELRN